MKQLDGEHTRHLPKIIKTEKSPAKPSSTHARPVKPKKMILKTRKASSTDKNTEKQSKTMESPELLMPNFDKIPNRLKAYPKWAVWKGEPRNNGKISKPPINPKTGRYAEVDDPSTFSTFAEAKKAFETGDYDGIGILVYKRKKQSILGVDIDDCIFGDKLTSKAEQIVGHLRTYTEKSPYDKGVRCIGVTQNPLTLAGCRRDKVELYTHNHFLTITGHRLNDNPLRDCEKAFKEVHAQYIGKIQPTKNNSLLEELRHSPLFNGDISAYDSESEADLDLCRMICRNGITDPQAIDSIFKESGLHDDKWDRSDYRDRTINKAIELEQQSQKTRKAEIELLDTEMMITTPPPEIPWLIRDFVPVGQIGEMIGDGKIGKSSLLFQMAIAVASGISKDPFSVDAPQRVLVVNVEDPSEQIHSRLHYQSKKFEGTDQEMLKENLLIVDGLGKIGPLMRLVANEGPRQSDYGIKLDEYILKVRPSLVILDTKSRLYGLDENNNDHATLWLFQLEKIAREVNCSFLIAHHTGKRDGKITGRGASAFDNNTRFRIILSPVEKTASSKFQLEEDERYDFFQMTAQSNYSAKSKIKYFRRDEAGIPVLMNLGEQRWYQAGEMLYGLLKNKTVTRQDLIRNQTEDAKAIRGQLMETHKITAKECGILLDNLEKKKRISYEKTSRGNGKIIAHGVTMA